MDVLRPDSAEVFFDTGLFDLDPTDTAILDQYVTFLQRNPTLNAVVAGYTDTVGDNASNQTLSNNRALAVFNYLTTHGIAAGRLTQVGHGEDPAFLAVPTPDNTDEQGNRRTEINVLAGDVYDVVYQPGGIIDVVGSFGHARSSDQGAHWAIHSLPAVGGAISIAASPDEPNVLFAVGQDNTLYESDNGGVAWTLLGQDTSPQGRIPFVTVNDLTGTAYDVWFGDTNLFRIPATSGGPGLRAATAASTLWVQSDNGATTTSGTWCSTAPRRSTPCRSSTLTTAGSTATRSTPSCPSGTSRRRRPTACSSWASPGWTSRAGTTRTCTSPCRTTAPGRAEGGRNNASTLWHNAASADAFDVAADDDRVLFNGGVFGAGRRRGAFVSTRGIPQFDNTPDLGANHPPGAVIDFKHTDAYDTWGDDKFAVLTNNTNAFGDNTFGAGGLYITSNIKAGVIQWTALTGNAASPKPNPALFADLQVALDGAGVPTFYVTVGSGTSVTADQLWKFVGTDPNGTWIQIDTNITGATGVSIFAADRANPLRLYAAAMTFAGPQIVRSNDGGVNWVHDLTLDTLMTAGGVFQFQNQHGPADFPFPAGAIATQGLSGYPQPTLLAFDPENANTIVAGGADSGLFLSTDNGANWRLLDDPLGTNPNVPHLPRPRGVHFDHEGGVLTLFVASQGAGVWRIKVDSPIPAAPAADATEPNDSIGTAEVFNLSEDSDGDHAPELNDRTIHNSTDVDFYKYTAEHTGNAIVNLYFDNLFGDLDLVVKKGDGTVIATGHGGNLKDHLDYERIVFPVSQGQDYFVEVFSAAHATGFYDLVIEKSIPELDLFVQAGIKTGSTLTGKLAFLQLDAKAVDDNFDGNATDGVLHDGKDPTQIRADFTVDIFNKNDPADERLSLFELGDLDAAIGVTADAEVNLALTLGLNKDLLPDTISAALPTLQANFLLDWSVGGPISDLTLDGGLNLIEFRDIRVDLGSFLSDTIGPVVSKIQEITEPLQPIIDIVTARIPVLSDLAGRTVTLADIAAAFGDFDPGMIYAVADIVSLVNSIDLSGGDHLALKLGDFKIFQKTTRARPRTRSPTPCWGAGAAACC